MSTVVEEAGAASVESTRMERNNSPTSSIRSVCRSLIQFWRSWIILGVPLVALPLLFQGASHRGEAGAENEVSFIHNVHVYKRYGGRL